MPTNDFLIVGTDPAANVDTQAGFLAWLNRGRGFVSGIAPSSTMNKILRQTSFMSSLIAQFVVDELGVDQLDDGVLATALANFKLAIGATTRIKLSTDLHLYVATTGSDSNNGLTSGTPFLTLQKAWTLIVKSYDLNGFNVTVHVANGVYAQGLSAQGAVLGLGIGNTVTFTGNTASPSACQIAVTNGNCFSAQTGANVCIQGFQVTATGTTGSANGYAVIAQTAGFMIVTGNMIFGAAGSAHVSGINTGLTTIIPGVSYTVNGSSPVHWYGGNGTVAVNGVTVNINGSPTFSSGFAAGNLLGSLGVYGNAFVGSALGPKYVVSANSVINTNGAGANYFPGSTVGQIATGGEYV